jgi:hypothetical protein
MDVSGSFVGPPRQRFSSAPLAVINFELSSFTPLAMDTSAGSVSLRYLTGWYENIVQGGVFPTFHSKTISFDLSSQNNRRAHKKELEELVARLQMCVFFPSLL